VKDTVLLALALRLLDRKARLRPDAAWHPSPEELTAYREGRLSLSQAGRIQRHLGCCCACPDLLLDLECFLQPGLLHDRSDEGPEESWEELRWLRSLLLGL